MDNNKLDKFLENLQNQTNINKSKDIKIKEFAEYIESASIAKKKKIEKLLESNITPTHFTIVNSLDNSDIDIIIEQIDDILKKFK